MDEEVKLEWLTKRYGKSAETSFNTARRHKATGKEFWESIVGSNCMFNSHYAIIPKKNLVSNKGLTENSTHSNTSKKYLPKATANLFEMQTYELEFPLKHPKHVLINQTYVDKVQRIMGTGHPFIRLYRRCVYIFKRIFVK